MSRIQSSTATCALWLFASLLIVFTLAPLSVEAGQSGVVLSGIPTGTTKETNPEIHVSAPGAVSYRYSINGAPYSDEIPISTSINFRADVRFGDRTFLAGTGDLLSFVSLRTTGDSFPPFLSSVALDDVQSQLQITYVLNRIRATVGAENVLNIWGPGVEALNATLKEKVPAAARYELSAFAVTGGKLSRETDVDSTRRFGLLLAPNSGSLTLTPTVNNSQTAITVNGQPVASGNSFVLPHPADGSSITLATAGPDGSHVSYTIEVTEDASLDQTDYRGYYLRAFNPATSYVSIRNTGTGTVAYGMTFNDKLGLTKQGIIHEIQALAPEYPDEPMQRKVWRFIRANRYHWDPLTEAPWFSSVALFFNSAGFGYCDDSASLFQELMTGLGYTARVWGLNGHVVAEVLVNGRWEMWDPDLEVYYYNRDGLVAGVQELVNDPTLIGDPDNPILPAGAWPYQQTVADIYASAGDNFLYPPASFTEFPVTLEIPAGGTFEFPDLYDAPLVTQYLSMVPSYTNARLVVPAGFSGALSVPLIIHSIGWSSHPSISVITRNAAGIWDAQPTAASWEVDCLPPITTASQPSGHYNPNELVTLVANEPATIYYTTDGSTPTEASAVYSAPVAISNGGSVKFFAVDAVGNHGLVRGYGPAVSQVALQISGMNATTASFAASASGGTGIYEYKYLLRDTHSVWSIVQSYGAATTWSFDKTGATPGSYLLVVWARNAGTTVEYDAEAWVAFSVTVNHAPILANPGDQVNADTSKTYPEGVLADGPLAYWRLGETSGTSAADSAGTNPGAVFGGATLGQGGALADGNPAVQFNGSNGYVEVANPAVSLAGDLTIELWLNVSLAARQTLISKDYLHEFELTLETWGQLNFYQGNGTTYEEIPLAFATIAANSWQHVVVTRTAATKTIRLYVNGILKGSRTYTAPVATGTRPVSIGRSDNGAKYVNGRLDEVALYPAALSGVQVAAHYALRTSVGGATVVALPLTASDPDGDGLTYGATGLPAGLTINTATGLISGTLSPASGGSHQVTATASDGSLAASQTFTWTVTHVNRAPTLTSPGTQASAENAGISLQLVAADPDGDALSYSATGLPVSLTIDAATGLIVGTLSYGSAGTYVVTATVSDGTVATSQTFTWTVAHTNRAPVLANPGTQTNWDIAGYAQGVLADGPLAYWRLGETSGTSAADSAGSNPGTMFGGVTLGQGGALADGNPAVQFNGSNGYVQVANPAVSLAGDLTIELWLNVSLAARQTLISKDYLHEFELTLETWGQLNFYQGNGTTYEEIPLAFATIAANSWQHVVVTRTAATKTIRLYVNGLLKGSRTYTAPVATGARPVSIGRSDNSAKYVNGRLDEVALYPAALSGVQVAAHYALRTSVGGATVVALPLTASDPDGDGLTYGATGLPAGLTINTATGLISGTLSPASGGSHQVTATASDGSLASSETFTWTVVHTNRAPVLANPGTQANWDIAGYAPGVLADGALAYWRFAETSGTSAADSAGTNPGTMFGGVTLGQGGALADGNPALQFNGSSSYIQVANPAVSLAGDLTIELWLNVSLAMRQTLISKSNLSEFELTLETWGQLNFYQGNGTTYEEIPLAFATLAANSWQHVVVTRTAATKTIRLYVNGILKGSRTYTTAAIASAKPVSLGRSHGGAKYVNGRLDEVALYPAALSGVQVAAHYALRTSVGGATVVALPLTASDPDGDGLTYGATGLPAGLTINTATGLISGTLSPASAGSHQVTATASDGSLAASQTFTWTVTHVN